MRTERFLASRGLPGFLRCFGSWLESPDLLLLVGTGTERKPHLVMAPAPVRQHEPALLLDLQGLLQNRQCPLFPERPDNPFDLAKCHRLVFA